MAKVETAVMHSGRGKKRPQAKESRQPPEAGRGKERILFQEPMEEPALPTS